MRHRVLLIDSGEAMRESAQNTQDLSLKVTELVEGPHHPSKIGEGYISTSWLAPLPCLFLSELPSFPARERRTWCSQQQRSALCSP
jgi:hypothetical protein